MSRRGPPGRWVLGGTLAVAGGLVVLLTMLALVIPVTMLANAGIRLPGEHERRVRSLDRQWELIREVERELPVYPGSQRVREVHETIDDGQARALAVCWMAPVDFESIRRFYLGILGTENGWIAAGGGTGAFRKGRVYLELGLCEGTYQLRFSYQL